MPKIPQQVIDAWLSRVDPVVFTTVDTTGVPNTIYVGSVRLYDETTLLIADNRFFKTRQNILSGSQASVLFISPERVAYQLKGRVSYHTDGHYYDDMKKWNPVQYPGLAVAVISIQEIYSGADILFQSLNKPESCLY